VKGLDRKTEQMLGFTWKGERLCRTRVKGREEFPEQFKRGGI